MIKENLKLLGMPVCDCTTKFVGVVSSVSFDLYGCVQAFVVPRCGKDGKIGEGCWFDAKRLTLTATKPVMPQPSFQKVRGGEKLKALGA